MATVISLNRLQIKYQINGLRKWAKLTKLFFLTLLVIIVCYFYCSDYSDSRVTSVLKSRNWRMRRADHQMSKNAEEFKDGVPRCSDYTRDVNNENRIYNLVFDRFEKLCDKEEFHFYSKEQLALTHSFILDKPNYCDNNKGKSLYLIMVVFSDVTLSTQRNLIRETWGNTLKAKGAKVLFLVGKSMDQHVQQILVVEDAQNGDIVQSGFDEDYYNLTLKTLAYFHWINNRCGSVKFTARADEDVIVDVDRLYKVLEAHEHDEKSIIGDIRESEVLRDEHSKLWIPMFAYKYEMWPEHVAGGFNVITADCVAPLLRESNNLTPLYLEDVYLTGIVANKAGLKRAQLPWDGNDGNSVAYHGYRGGAFKLATFGIRNNFKPHQVPFLDKLLLTVD